MRRLVTYRKMRFDLAERVRLFIEKGHTFQRTSHEVFMMYGGTFVNRWEAYAVTIVAFAKLAEPLSQYGDPSTELPMAHPHAQILMLSMLCDSYIRM